MVRRNTGLILLNCGLSRLETGESYIISYIGNIRLAGFVPFILDFGTIWQGLKNDFEERNHSRCHLIGFVVSQILSEILLVNLFELLDLHLCEIHIVFIGGNLNTQHEGFYKKREQIYHRILGKEK